MNYANEWKKQINFQLIKYDDFVAKYHKLTNTYFLQKIDGQLGALVFERGREPFFQSTTGAIIRDLPVIEEYKEMVEGDISISVLIGELVGMKGNKILPFNQTESIVKRNYIEVNKSLIHHYLYDVLYFENDKIKSFPEAYKIIQKYWSYIRNSTYIHIPTIIYGGLGELRSLYNIAIKQPGMEGIVARLRDGRNYKIKKVESFDLCLIGAGNKSMPAWKKEQISYLKVAFIDKNGHFRLSSRVGTGFTEKERSYFYDYIMEKKIQELDNGDILVPPEKVIEVNWADYLIKPMPVYEFTGSEYIDRGTKDSATMRFPSFSRERTDKKVNDFDVRLQQVPDFPLTESLDKEVTSFLLE